MSVQTKDLTASELRALVQGLPRYCAGVALVLGGQLRTSAQLLTILTNLVDADAAVRSARSALAQAIALQTRGVATDGLLAKELREIVGLMFAAEPGTLEALAISPRKPPAKLSSEARLACTAKARATRIARGTKSRKQLLKIKGNVVGVSVTPVTAEDAAETGSREDE